MLTVAFKNAFIFMPPQIMHCGGCRIFIMSRCPDVPGQHRHFCRFVGILNGFRWNFREIIVTTNWLHFGRNCTRDKGWSRKLESTSNWCCHKRMASQISYYIGGGITW